MFQRSDKIKIRKCCEYACDSLPGFLQGGAVICNGGILLHGNSYIISPSFGVYIDSASTSLTVCEKHEKTNAVDLLKELFGARPEKDIYLLHYLNKYSNGWTIDGSISYYNTDNEEQVVIKFECGNI